MSFFRLNNSHIANWDEAFYADGIRSMLSTHEFVVPYWNQRPFLDKPPLHLWVASLGRAFIGESSAGYRFTSAVSIFVTMILVYVFTRNKYGTLPALIAVLCLVSNNVFIWRGRGANTDGLLTLLIFLVFLAAHLKNKWKYAILGFLLSLVYLTKSTVVVFPILVLGLLEIQELWLERRNIKWKTKIWQWLSGLFFILLLPSLWLLAGYTKLGISFVNFYLWKSDYEASDISVFTFNTMYFKSLITTLSFLIPLVVIGIAKAFTRLKDATYLALLAFGLILLITLSFSPIHYHWYLMPSFPMLAILAGIGLVQIKKINSTPTFLLIVLIGIGFVSLFQFDRKIKPLFFDDVAFHQAESGLWLKEHSDPNDIIVRLDGMYPTLIFYSQRRVFSSSPSQAPEGGNYLSRPQLLPAIHEGRYKWLNGRTSEIQDFAMQLKPGSYRLYEITNRESVLEITQP